MFENKNNIFKMLIKFSDDYLFLSFWMSELEAHANLGKTVCVKLLSFYDEEIS